MAKIPKSKDELNERQEKFCREYLIDLNGTKAAERAGYKPKGAAVEASRLLRNPKVVVHLNALREKQIERTEVKADEVLRELMRIGYSDLRGLFTETGSVKPMADWPDDLARAVASIEIDEIFEGHGADRVWIGYTKKIKFWPKDRGLEMLGKHQKLFTDKVEIEDKTPARVQIVKLPANTRDKGK